MTQRSIPAGPSPRVIVRSGWDATVAGWESERVEVKTSGIFGLTVKRSGDDIEVDAGMSGEVRVPLGSSVKVYAGRSAEISNLRGSVAAYAGWNCRIHQVRALVSASSGWAMDVDCETVEGDDVKVSAGRSIRFRVRQLTDVHYVITDIGGRWEAVLGDGRIRIRLKAGGDVTLVTDQDVTPQAPDQVVGDTEKPVADGGERNAR